MASWNSRGLRGSMLEESLNMTNEKYRREKLALVQKIPTPITPMEFDKAGKGVTRAEAAAILARLKAQLVLREKKGCLPYWLAFCK